MGARQYWLDEAERVNDTEVFSPATQREWDRGIAAHKQGIAAVMQDQWLTFLKHASDNVEQVGRLSHTGVETARGLSEAVRKRQITAEEAEEQIVACLDEADNTLRPLLDNARETEERVWSEVNVTPAAYERAMAQRAPALFRGGKNLLVLPTEDD